MNDSTRKFSKELNSGTTSLALLALLVQSNTPMYGYELGMKLAGMSDDELPMNQGALYPVLRSLENEGLLTSEIQPSTSGPPRRYYRPTAEGRSEFKRWKAVWTQTRNWLDEILEQDHEQRSERPTRHR
jgi:PadR family transcriptional regulator, regulatory protein PadR